MNIQDFIKTLLFCFLWMSAPSTSAPSNFFLVYLFYSVVPFTLLSSMLILKLSTGYFFVVVCVCRLAIFSTGCAFLSWPILWFLCIPVIIIPSLAYFHSLVSPSLWSLLMVFISSFDDISDRLFLTASGIFLEWVGGVVYIYIYIKYSTFVFFFFL